MRAYELAKKLLEGPNHPVVVHAESDEAPCWLDEVSSMEEGQCRFTEAGGEVVQTYAIRLS